MKAIMVMFDSLNRNFLPPYGCDWTHAPNFARLARRAATFDCSYVSSMPCMPARRELHTARPNFLHRSWGPLEPFDDSMPQMLGEAGVYAHLCSDHYHYWEDGGATYHNRYNSWEFFRGQEGDPWIGQVADPVVPPNLNGKGRRQDWVNRAFLDGEIASPQHQTFAAGLDFIKRNRDADNWLLQIETFDPHEPFFAPENYQDLYPHAYFGPLFDWPGYGETTETPEQIEHCRLQYAALLSQCDANLGRVLDAMDAGNLWADTMLIVWTDHGFLLGEHGYWAKTVMPWYEELARTPFWVHDPRAPRPGARRQSLVQPALDIGPTLLEFFGLEKAPDMLGQELRATIENDAPVREAAIFGAFGGQVNVTDGRHVYLRATENPAIPLPQWTLMPTHMRDRFGIGELRDMELSSPLSFTKGCQVLKIGGTPKTSTEAVGIPAERPETPDKDRTLLFDLQTDPRQQTPLQDAEVEARMIEHLTRLMRQCDAPPEQFARLGLAEAQFLIQSETLP